MRSVKSEKMRDFEQKGACVSIQMKKQTHVLLLLSHDGFGLHSGCTVPADASPGTGGRGARGARASAPGVGGADRRGGNRREHSISLATDGDQSDFFRRWEG